MSTSPPELVACHECDLLERVPPLKPGAVARCTRCGGLLARAPRRSLERTAALGFAALILFCVANIFPFLSLKAQGKATEMTIIAGAGELWRQGGPELAALVLGTTVLGPALHIGLMLWVVVPLTLGARPAGGVRAFRWLMARGRSLLSLRSYRS